MKYIWNLYLEWKSSSQKDISYTRSYTKETSIYRVEKERCLRNTPAVASENLHLWLENLHQTSYFHSIQKRSGNLCHVLYSINKFASQRNMEMIISETQVWMADCGFWCKPIYKYKIYLFIEENKFPFFNCMITENLALRRLSKRTHSFWPVLEEAAGAVYKWMKNSSTEWLIWLGFDCLEN